VLKLAYISLKSDPLVQDRGVINEGLVQHVQWMCSQWHVNSHGQHLIFSRLPSAVFYVDLHRFTPSSDGDC
jgi:hypothetical protein